MASFATKTAMSRVLLADSHRLISNKFLLFSFDIIDFICLHGLREDKKKSLNEHLRSCFYSLN